MERDWIPPEPHGVERVGSDEDLVERGRPRAEFEGEFGERDAAREVERETPDEPGPR